MQMREAVCTLTVVSAGQTVDLAGSVRVTARVFVSNFVLPQILAELHQIEARIQLEFVPNDGA